MNAPTEPIIVRAATPAPEGFTIPARPAVSRRALPALRAAYRLEMARWRKMPNYKRVCGDVGRDIRRQIKAAVTGAPTWTNELGTVYGYGLLVVGGTMPRPGGNSFQEPLGF